MKLTLIFAIMLLASVSIAAQNTLEERTRCRDTCGPKLDCAKTCLFCYDCIRNGKKLDASSAKALQCKTECARHYDAGQHSELVACEAKCDCLNVRCPQGQQGRHGPQGQ
ncbi:unnamed protein product [Tilletia laevis]|uniref:Extracellular membrane protein CFEM domain-containing protein n=1 Tax=Tilletia laevis TaxID=157183 RepID=A0A9N8MAC8_9BASI|nr:unnamed protein product [Tilletia laevis]CAD6972355.1 unnamed protein product [Tilletia controversa]